MLPRINRIKKKKDFETIFKNSKGFKNNLFILRISKNNLGLNRFGFVVSKKISKKAIIRNRIKRRMSEAIKGEAQKIKTGTDLVLIASPGIDKKDFSEIKETISNALLRARLIV